MNFTMVRITAISLATSPILSQSIVFNRQNIFTFNRLKLHNFITPFFINHHYHCTLKLSSSRFVNFLNRALCFKSCDIYNKEITIHLQINSSDTSSIIIMDSTFTNCTSLRSHGGAIFFTHDIKSISIIRNTFTTCQSKKGGGALYGSIKDVIIHFNFFYQCTAIVNGHAFTFYHRNSTGTTEASECTVKLCATKEKLIGMAAINDVLGESNMRLINITNCHSALMASCFSLLIHFQSTLSFSTLQNSTGPHLIKTYDTKENSTFSYLNIIYNSIHNSLFSLESDTGFYKCIIINNNFNRFGELTPSFEKKLMSISFYDCTIDFKLEDKNIINNIFTFYNKGVLITKSTNTIPIIFMANKSMENILRQMENMIPEKYHDLYEHKLKINYLIPTKRIQHKQDQTINSFTSPKTTMNDKIDSESVSLTPTFQIEESVFHLFSHNTIEKHTFSQSLQITEELLPNESNSKEHQVMNISLETIQDSTVISTRSTSITFNSLFIGTNQESLSLIPSILYISTLFVFIIIFGSFLFVNFPNNEYSIVSESKSTSDSSSMICDESFHQDFQINND
ncbi:hypothetical protein TRFO_16195 [Tritrichomonas foetus]|uniref:Uncharacterized protein n=1 Tax=Tritrichomonas foetus TaxID=1144522 RepID=A0A1J4KVB3_9EUKA|nr:hypothetical protein TRFO_16195 [Tritrichomonas foetus]|eukprot:OHT13638.1 hypothetical protein TRFO_16195 [Tritrichomonas foetus]